MSEDDIRWDEAKAAALVGATVVVGMTYRRASGDEMEQMHGTVVVADREDVIAIALAGTRAGERFTLPPDTPAFRPAGPGHYRLRATGEIVVDPDYTVTYVVHRNEERD